MGARSSLRRTSQPSAFFTLCCISHPHLAMLPLSPSCGSRASWGCSRHGHRRRSLLLAMFGLVAVLGVVLVPLPAAATCAVDADCSGHGVCLASLVCQCASGWLGPQCSIGSTASTPVYVALIEGLKGQHILQEWTVQPPASPGASSTLRMRWTVNTNTWWGVVSNIHNTSMQGHAEECHHMRACRISHSRSGSLMVPFLLLSSSVSSSMFRVCHVPCSVRFSMSATMA